MGVRLSLAGADVQYALAVLVPGLPAPVWCSLLMMFPTVHLTWFILLNSFLTLSFSVSLLNFLTLLLTLLSELLLFCSCLGPGWIYLLSVFSLAFVWPLCGVCDVSAWRVTVFQDRAAVLSCPCIAVLHVPCTSPGFSLFCTLRGGPLVEQPAPDGSDSSTTQHGRSKLLQQQQQHHTKQEKCAQVNCDSTQRSPLTIGLKMAQPIIECTLR